jgi:hypothetical protein
MTSSHYHASVDNFLPLPLLLHSLPITYIFNSMLNNVTLESHYPPPQKPPSLLHSSLLSFPHLSLLTFLTPSLNTPSFPYVQIVDLSLILKDNAPSKTVNPDDEFADNLWDSEEQKADQEEEDPFWK